MKINALCPEVMAPTKTGRPPMSAASQEGAEEPQPSLCAAAASQLSHSAPGQRTCCARPGRCRSRTRRRRRPAGHGGQREGATRLHWALVGPDATSSRPQPALARHTTAAQPAAHSALHSLQAARLPTSRVLGPLVPPSGCQAAGTGPASRGLTVTKRPLGECCRDWG